MQVDNLFTKIGILVMENDMLRAELNRAKERIAELEKEPQPDKAGKSQPKSVGEG